MNGAASHAAPGARWAEALCAWACCAPLFVVTVRGWASWVLLTDALGCLVLLILVPAAPSPSSSERRPAVGWVLAALLASALAVAFSALLRGELRPPEFDAPARAWAAIPIFLVALRWRLDPARYLRYTLPAALVLTLAHQFVVPQPRWWTAARMSTYFADPLVFGYLSLALAMMCLVSIPADEWHSRPRRVDALKLAAVPIGLWLSVESGSRSGWLAIPILLAVWLQGNVRVAHRWGRAFMPLAVVLVACAVAAVAFQFIPRVHLRVHEAVDDMTAYSFEGVAPKSSVGLRITYLRIAKDIVVRHPWAGVGDTSHRDPEPASAFPYASAEAVNTAFRSGMHNQVVSNAVRWGVAGALAAAMLLLVPLVVFARHVRAADPVTRENAAMGLAFATCIAIGSLTTEVVDLKYTASFHALITALLCGACLARDGQD